MHGRRQRRGVASAAAATLADVQRLEPTSRVGWLVLCTGLAVGLTPDAPRGRLRDALGMFGNFAVVATLVAVVLDRRAASKRARIEETARSVAATSDGWLYVEELFMQNDELRNLYYEINRELGYPRPADQDAPRTPRAARLEYHMVTYLIQVVQNVYMLEDLARVLAEGKHSGWVTAFRMWFRSPTVRRIWGAVTAMYNKEFQAFVAVWLVAPANGYV
jgi:hypothetical protein